MNKIFNATYNVNVAGTDIQLSDKLKILGATLDSNLTMESHIKALYSSCFYHIKSNQIVYFQATWPIESQNTETHS